MIYDIFKNKKCFKLICGAGNEDITEVERLVMLYSTAGCQMFDICAKKSVIEAAKLGLKKSGIINDRYLCISVGSESDQHFCKAEIDRFSCGKCNKCKDICNQTAISNNNSEIVIDKTRCIGCRKCIDICPTKSIKLVQNSVNLKEVLPELINTGIDCIEFHVAGNEADTFQRWNDINKMFDGALSISINRSKASDEHIIELIQNMINIRKPFTTIIQADGVPMSGGNDDYRSTLQAVATADIFRAKNLPAYIIVSGGTNSKTAKLASICGVNIDGVAIGSFARKIVKEYIQRNDFYENKEVFNKALSAATDLIASVSLQI